MSDIYKILFVEDEEALGVIVKESLEYRGFEVLYCRNGKEAWRVFQQESPDICVLDVMMPLKDGFTLAEEIREENQEIPIIFVTARTQVDDVVKGFNCGANDYIRKPFSIEELIVRIKALCNRKNITQETIKETEYISMNIGDILYKEKEEVLIYEGETIGISPRESQIIRMLITNKQKVLKREQILTKLWGNDSFFNSRSLDVHLTKIRKKLSVDPNVKLITIRGEGLKLIWP